jgi:hypothetical protein
VNVGVVSLVRLSVFEQPRSLAAVRTGVVGAAGADVSIVTLKAPEAGETLPATSVSLAVMLCMPSLKVLVVIVAVVELATTDPTTFVPSKMVTVFPEFTEPTVKVGVLTLVTLSVDDDPVSVVKFGVLGAASAVVSIVTLNEPDVAILPATSVARAVIVLVPEVRTLVVIE